MEKYIEALKYEIFENKEYGFLDDVIINSKIIFDVGGHLGYFTEYCLNLNQNLFIHFWEPIEEIFNEAKNRINHKNIYRNNSAVMDKNGFHNFFVNNEKTMQSSIFNNTFLNPNGIKTKVIIEKLDNYIDNRKIQKVDLVKIDVEGSEFDIIQSLGKKHLNKIHNLCIEYHILDSSYEKKFDMMLDKLKNIYKHTTILPSKYTNKVGYIFARKQGNNY